MNPLGMFIDRRSVTEGLSSLTRFNKERCPSCGHEVSVGQFTGVSYGKSFVSCVCCLQRFCSSCIFKTTHPIPVRLWHPKAEKTPNLIGYVCRDHQAKAVYSFLIEKVNEATTDYVGRLDMYLEGCGVEDIEKPVLFKESGVATRLTKLAFAVVKYTPYSAYSTAIKYAMMGRAAIGLLLDKEVMNTLVPLMPLLSAFDIKSPYDMLSVYYLGCNNELQRKLALGSTSQNHTAKFDSSIQERYLELLGKYAGPAMWLYAAMLPPPHHTVEWGNWYFSRLIANEGWKVIACQSDSQQLPDGSLCPAFALVVRSNLSRSPHLKEALLVIRGSKNITDWRINGTKDVTAFVYRAGQCGEHAVTGGVHTGMLVATRAILDVFVMRRCIYKLLDQGYDVKLVGHSLGAGIAALIAAELKNGLYRRQLIRRSDSFKSLSQKEQEDLLCDVKHLFLGLNHENSWMQESPEDNNYSPSAIPFVQAVGYGTPPCVGENLADAFIDDGIVVSMVHNDDIIPCLSPKNIKALAEEVKEFSTQAREWYHQDQVRMELYARSIGKEGAMTLAGRSSGRGSKVSEKEDDQSATMPESKDDCLDNVDVDKDHNETCPPIREQRGTPGLSSPDEMMVPGKIIFFSKTGSAYHAEECDSRYTGLQKINLFRNSISDHMMSAHIHALRMLKLSRHPMYNVQTPPRWEPIYDSASHEWASCSVCGSEPTWPFITNSDASRALVYHHCRACGKPVCVICAPAGDSIPDVGIGEYQMLKDYRIPIPSIGLLMPERVCLPCFMHCYGR